MIEVVVLVRKKYRWMDGLVVAGEVENEREGVWGASFAVFGGSLVVYIRYFCSREFWRKEMG
jgi:hypothetical protein